MAFLNQIVSLLTKLLCGTQQQNQQHQYPQQQQQQQQQQQPYQQQQQGYPPQQQPSWSQVASGGHGHGHQQSNNQNRPPQGYGKPPQQQGGSAQDYYNNQTQPFSQHTPNGQQWSYQPQHAQYGGYPSKPLPAGGVVGPHHPGHQNNDQVNATNEQYVNLRNQARRAGDEAHRCFASSQQAYQRGDGAKAHELSQEGKRHQAEQDKLDDQASEWIYNENNRDSPPGTIDLHGLYVKEAIERTEAAIANGQRQGMEELRVIVGKGIHSQGHVAKIKPAVQDLMRKYHLSAHIDPHNTGVLVVDLQGRDQGGRSRDAGGLMDDMEKDDSGCVIM